MARRLVANTVALRAVRAGIVLGLALLLPTHGSRPRPHASSATTPTCGWHRADGVKDFGGDVWGCAV